jgi:hypothetical protein
VKNRRASGFVLISVSCINRDLATLRRILNVARLWKVILTVPVIRLLPGGKNHERVLADREEDVYLTAQPNLLRFKGVDKFEPLFLAKGILPGLRPAPLDVLCNHLLIDLVE